MKSPPRKKILAQLKGFTLIEMIGILAAIAILAALLLPALTKQSDKIMADFETATLQSLGDALQRSVLRNRYIPGTNDWASAIGTEMSLDISEVVTNSRGLIRYFVVDPNLAIGANGAGLPYGQTNYLFGSVVTNSSGQVIPPINPRIMLLSSLGRPFTNVVNGILPTSGDFSNIWNTADGTVPTATAFNNWRGTGQDLKIQRINLAPLFVRLMLFTNTSTTLGYYSIDNSSSSNLVSSAITNGGFFLQNSVLNLYSQTNTSITSSMIDSQQILSQDASFAYYQNAWRTAIVGTNGLIGIAGAGGAGGVSGTNLTGYDFSGLVTGFLQATPTSLGRTQQNLIVQDFVNYMNAYNTWAASSFTNNSSYNNATAAQTTLMNDVNNLVNAIVPN